MLLPHSVTVTVWAPLQGRLFICALRTFYLCFLRMCYFLFLPDNPSFSPPIKI